MNETTSPLLPGTAPARDRHGRRGAICRFGADRDGVVAVLFALMLVPILLGVGAAVDYSRVSRAKASLDVAADAAVMSAIRRVALAGDRKAAEDNARLMFTAAARSVASASVTALNVNVTDEGTTRRATLTYEASVPVTFMGLTGTKVLTVAGDSVGRSGIPSYMDFYLLLDNTPSMGLGATTADIATLVAKTPDGCAFACHDLSASKKDDYYTLAKKLGVQMRIDVVRQATQNLMDTAAKTALIPNQFRTAIYTFGTSCTDVKLTPVSALTANLSAAKSDASAIGLMTIPYQNYNNDQCTDFDKILAAMEKAIPAAGDGGSAGSAQKVLFLVSDGVGDAYYPTTCSQPTTGGRCQEPMKIATCTALKARGVRIAVLYTTYLPLPTNGWYNTWIAPFASRIGTQMQACATPGLYFEVSPTQGISEAMAALFQKAVAQAKLTQ
ncbi:TadE/TadG family type IV pilus assembly protein [Salinarimonas soli]|uniref:Pilus assembly protein n=1 Tax=Salinarimonas soli TaxID=1638099 RepID=A0A5B2VBL3_9HYPH|nr:TadE/TadG family type IV pilus assembly protein [Salinarimonas soli]KAA2236118.1 pilus assembly protein [Salinarimonas soli]